MRKLNMNERAYIEKMIKSSGDDRLLMVNLDDVMVESMGDGGWGAYCFSLAMQTVL
jgi:hypothetical protein